MHHPGSSVEIAPYALPHEVFAVPIAVDLTGKQFGRLTVLRLSGHNIHRQREWLCRCACGTELVLPSVRFRTGNTSSCGCLKREVNRLLNLSHGASGGANAGYAQFPGAYKSWLAMRARCLNPGAVQYHHYGGRGITVHPRWLASYEAFLADMGERPAGTSLDRINPNRNYEPGNCRWATRAEQARTKRSNRHVIVAGVSMAFVDACATLGLNYGSMRQIAYRTKLTPQQVVDEFISGKRKSQIAGR